MSLVMQVTRIENPVRITVPLKRKVALRKKKGEPDEASDDETAHEARTQV